MSQERYWYQDGWVMLFITAIVLFFGYSCHQQAQEQAKMTVLPMLTGRLNQPFFGSPSLEITFWHQSPGNLQNGVLTVTATGSMVQRGKDLKAHSFEVWEPNENHAVTLTFPLQNYDATQEIPIEIALFGKGIKTWSTRDAWVGQTWKSNLESQPQTQSATP